MDRGAFGYAEEWAGNLRGMLCFTESLNVKLGAVFSFGMPGAGADFELNVEDAVFEFASRGAVLVGENLFGGQRARC